MRLTLRTLLAYMDEILEPADREELAKKVESSEFAHDLIHRTKDTMRRLRLSAPQVVGTGVGLDPNTVAEYLDNVLPPDSVADFERICLESDVHLAEVASAHHVLTMVLGEPAEVDPAARQRMYAIPTEAEHRKQIHIESAHTPPAAGRDFSAVSPLPAVFPSTSVAPAVRSHENAVPDYLRANSWTRHRALLAMCAAVLLVAVGVLLTSGMTDWLGGSSPQLASKSSNEVAAEPANETPDTSAETINSPLATEGTADVATDNSAAPPAMSATPPRMLLPSMSSASKPPSSPPPSSPPQESSVAVDTPPAVVTVDESAYGYGEPPTETPTEPDDRYAVEPTDAAPPVAAANIAPAPADIANVTPAPPANGNIALPGTDSAAPAADTMPAETPVSETPATDSIANDVEMIEEAMGETAGATSEEPAELGTYLDGKNVLLRFDPQAGAWFRMTPRATLYPGDKLLALPAFFPKLSLASGLHLKLPGGTQITLGPGEAGSNEPTIDVAYGKVVLVNTANDESGVRLTIGTETADVRLGRNATLAVDVVRKYTPGLDPRKLSSPILANLYVRDGDVEWTDSLGSRTIPAPGQWSVENGVVSLVSADVTFPEWIDREPVEQRSEQLFGAPAVEMALDPTRPVEEQLLELYQSSRRREVKSLVARSSVYTGLFVPFIEALRDSDQKSAWKTHVDTLRSAMALGPESAEQIWQTLVDQRGEAAAADLYEMLCGYGPEQIGAPDQFATGLATQLVDWMEDDSLDYRVLAVQDMGEITGMRLMSNPAGTPTERARGIRLWRQRIKNGEVAPLSP